MACNNGKTYLNSLVPFPGGTAATTTYLVDLTHYTCGGRRICSLEAFPVTADLNYKVQSIESVGKGYYNLNVLATGTVSYMPYNPGCPCGSCPVTEPIYAYLSVPYASDAEAELVPGECECTLNGISCACNTSSSIDITAAFTLDAAAQATGD